MDPLSNVPARLVAGDSLTIRRTFPTIATGDGYTLTLKLVAIGGTITSITASEDAGAFVFAILPTSLAAVAPGVVSWAFVATQGSAERYTLEEGTTVLAPDPTNTATAQTTQLAHIERVIAVCEATIESKLTDDMQMYQLPDGVTVSKLPLSEVRALLAQYRAKRSSILRGGRQRVREIWYQCRG